MQASWLREFIADWQLSGRSRQTAEQYVRYIKDLNSYYQNPTLADVKEWLHRAPGASVRRKKAQSVRALGRWCEEAGIDEFPWWRQVPLAVEEVIPQATVTEEIYRQVMSRCESPRDRALIEVLWSTGLRRAEISRLAIEHVDFVNGYVVVVTSKSKKPRAVPTSPKALRAIRKLIGRRTEGPVFQMSGNAIRLRLIRLDAPSAHAWRRGWAVSALRHGVSETSVKSAAGWASGAMVSRYTATLTSELALVEFTRAWSNSETAANHKRTSDIHR